MTPDQKRVFPNRTSSQEFLFYKADAKPEVAKPEDLSSVEPIELANAFPDISAGKAFRDQAMVKLDSVSKFAAIAVRIDNLGAENNDAQDKPSADVRMAVAQTIDSICKNDGGLWGQLERNVFGCYWAESDETVAKELGQRLKQNLATLRPETVTLGIAVYPLSDFLKVQILGNARKALDHAAFFGPDSSVAFDAVSLNISGDTFYQKGDIDAAIKEFKTALSLDPSNVNVHNSLGVCYGVLGDFENAKAEFKEAILLDPKETMAVYNLGHVHQLMDNKEKALQFFHAADDHEEDIFEVTLQTGKLYLEAEKPEKSKEFLE